MCWYELVYKSKLIPKTPIVSTTDSPNISESGGEDAGGIGSTSALAFGNELESGVTIEEEQKEHVCDTLLMCIITTLNQGLRNGGGIGDVLRAPSKEV